MILNSYTLTNTIDYKKELKLSFKFLQSNIK